MFDMVLNTPLTIAGSENILREKLTFWEIKILNEMFCKIALLKW